VTGWIERLRDGLAKTANRLSGGIVDLVRKRRLDQAMLDELEELLLQADLGIATTSRLIADLKRLKFDRDVTADEVRDVFARDIAAALRPVARALDIPRDGQTRVVLTVGVNGSGKTTTVGKFARLLRDNGFSVMIAACDTFRAAAVEQLQIWASRAGATVVAGAANADPAGLAYEAFDRARRERADVLLIDTAGRLHNKRHLMAELAKIVRVLKKIDGAAPHAVLLVLDATIGQNAHSQVETFREMVAITGLVVTKLDGTAKGGVLVALAERFGLPVHAVGVGEGIDDLQPFEAEAFARGLLGISS
jgi:fused signal recognition particle receptor